MRQTLPARVANIAKYERTLRSSRKEAIYFIDHVFSPGSIALQGVLNELRGVRLVAAFLNGGPADYPPGLRKIISKCPAIKLVPRQ